MERMDNLLVANSEALHAQYRYQNHDERVSARRGTRNLVDESEVHR